MHATHTIHAIHASYTQACCNLRFADCLTHWILERDYIVLSLSTVIADHDGCTLSLNADPLECL